MSSTKAIDGITWTGSPGTRWTTKGGWTLHQHADHWHLSGPGVPPQPAGSRFVDAAQQAARVIHHRPNT